MVDVTRVCIHLQVYNYNRYECGNFAGVQSLRGNEHILLQYEQTKLSLRYFAVMIQSYHCSMNKMSLCGLTE